MYGFIVPASAFRYGSHLMAVTLYPLTSSIFPMLQVSSPFPSPLRTPPVIKTYFVKAKTCQQYSILRGQYSINDSLGDILRKTIAFRLVCRFLKCNIGCKLDIFV